MKTQRIPIRQNVVKTIGSLCAALMLGLFTHPTHAQSAERTVTGIVSCTDGVLPLATVILKGTQIGVSTDENGAFTFPKKLKEKDVLLVSYLGYEDAEVTITGNTTFIKPFLEDIPLIIIGSLRTESLENKED